MGLHRANPDGSLDMGFNPTASDSRATVYAIAFQADGKMLVAGAFRSIGGQTQFALARLDPVTGLADSFDAQPNAAISVLALQPDGKILAGGSFTGGDGARALEDKREILLRGWILLQPRRIHSILNPNQALCCNAPYVRAIALEENGKVWVGGDFIGMAPDGGAQITRNHIALVEMDGRADQTLNLSAVGTKISATAMQPDGKMLIGGNFSSVLGVSRNNIARLNTRWLARHAFRSRLPRRSRSHSRGTGRLYHGQW